MRLLRQIPSWLKSKYLLTGAGFVLWLLFFDDRDILTNMKHRRELQQLEQSRNYYRKQVETTQKELNQLKNDPAILEKYAREKYRMKKDNEDLFIIGE